MTEWDPSDLAAGHESSGDVAGAAVVLPRAPARIPQDVAVTPYRTGEEQTWVRNSTGTGWVLRSQVATTSSAAPPQRLTEHFQAWLWIAQALGATKHGACIYTCKNAAHDQHFYSMLITAWGRLICCFSEYTACMAHSLLQLQPAVCRVFGAQIVPCI